MSPNATTIEQEGVYIDNFKLVDDGRFLEDETRALLTGAKYPARRPDKNIADLKAQVAANAKGEAELALQSDLFSLCPISAQEAETVVQIQFICRATNGRVTSLGHLTPEQYTERKETAARTR